MFVRFGYPPNALGYCGPSDAKMVADLVTSGSHEASAELEHLIEAFLGAWPYLDLIAQKANLSPLDYSVVEAYWLGNSLIEDVDPLTWGNSLDERFRQRAGWDWDNVVGALNEGGVPNHAFHVFCVYPWVGLLQSGTAAAALEVLDRCRIRWGRVVESSNGKVLVESRPLRWDGATLDLGDTRVESVDAPITPEAVAIHQGDDVALHWNFVCQTLTAGQLQTLRANHDRHLALVNRAGRHLGRRIED
jgi:hypothetical protein